MGVFLGTVSRDSPQNWPLAKQVGLWGVTKRRAPAARRVETGDQIIIWLGGRGYGAVCHVTAPARSPKGAAEAPWEGGVYQWQFVVPFEVVIELDAPLWLPFNGDSQERTGLSKAQFRSSFQSLPDDKGAVIVALVQRAKKEAKHIDRSKGARRQKP